MYLIPYIYFSGTSSVLEQSSNGLTAGFHAFITLFFLMGSILTHLFGVKNHFSAPNSRPAQDSMHHLRLSYLFLP